MDSILMKIKNWQMNNGVSRGNFGAYKKFTSRKNKKLRQRLGISYGRKFSKKKYDELFVNNENIENMT